MGKDTACPEDENMSDVGLGKGRFLSGVPFTPGAEGNKVNVA